MDREDETRRAGAAGVTGAHRMSAKAGRDTSSSGWSASTTDIDRGRFAYLAARPAPLHA